MSFFVRPYLSIRLFIVSYRVRVLLRWTVSIHPSLLCRAVSPPLSLRVLAILFVFVFVFFSVSYLFIHLFIVLYRMCLCSCSCSRSRSSRFNRINRSVSFGPFLVLVLVLLRPTTLVPSTPTGMVTHSSFDRGIDIQWIRTHLSRKPIVWSLYPSSFYQLVLYFINCITTYSSATHLCIGTGPILKSYRTGTSKSNNSIRIQWIEDVQSCQVTSTP